MAIARISRRSFLKGTAAGAAATVFPAPFIRSASAATRDLFVFASTEPVTGNWDPTSHTSAGQINFEGFVFGALFRTPMRPDNPSEVVWELATAQKLIDEYTMEFKLRDGVTFHNGAPFSAEDVKASFEYTSQPERPAYGFFAGPCEVEVVDRLTARLHTKKFGYPAAAWQFCSAFVRIMSKDDVKNPKVLAERPNGTGPFKYERQDGNTTHLVAFKDYLRGAPKLKRVDFSYIPDATTRVLGLMGGNIDLLERLEPEQYESVRKNKGLRVWEAPSTENKYLHFRCNKPPFDNELVRRAAAHAIDRSQILALLGAAGSANNSYISKLKFGYEDVPNYPEYNPKKCQELLSQAGFPNGNGLPALEYITSQGFYPKTKEYGEVITALLQAQGFNVSLTVLDPASWNDRLYQTSERKAPGHMIDCGWITPTPEPDMVLRAMFYSKAGPRGGIINGIQDKDIDAALEKERGAPDLATREPLVRKATEVIAAKVPSLSLFTSMNLNACRATLQDVYVYPNGPIDVSRAYYKEA